jgi:hypothetical protein
VLKCHRVLHHLTLGSRVIQQEKSTVGHPDSGVNLVMAIRMNLISHNASIKWF